MKLILFLDCIPNLVKAEIDHGNYPDLALKIVSIIRSWFLLSNDMRHSNEIRIFCSDQFREEPIGLMIEIIGKHLRYLNPDERETLLLLQKMTNIIYGTTRKKRYKRAVKHFQHGLKTQSTPGIKFTRCKHKKMLEEVQLADRLFFITNIKDKQLQTISGIRSLVERLKPNDTLFYSINQRNGAGVLKQLETPITTFYDNKLNSTLFIWQLLNIIQIFMDHNQAKKNENPA